MRIIVFGNMNCRVCPHFVFWLEKIALIMIKSAWQHDFGFSVTERKSFFWLTNLIKKLISFQMEKNFNKNVLRSVLSEKKQKDFWHFVQEWIYHNRNEKKNIGIVLLKKNEREGKLVCMTFFPHLISMLVGHTLFHFFRFTCIFIIIIITHLMYLLNRYRSFYWCYIFWLKWFTFLHSLFENFLQSNTIVCFINPILLLVLYFLKKIYISFFRHTV